MSKANEGKVENSNTIKDRNGRLVLEEALSTKDLEGVLGRPV